MEGWCLLVISTQHSITAHAHLGSATKLLPKSMRSCQASGYHGLLQSKISDSLCAQAWDQSVYNQEIFFLAHGPYTAPNVTVRVMDIYKFMNSKVSASFVVLVQVAISVGGEPCSSAWAVVVLSAACSRLWRCRTNTCDGVRACLVPEARLVLHSGTHVHTDAQHRTRAVKL